MKETIFKALFALCGLISIFAVGMICLFLFTNAIPTIAQIGFFDFIFGSEWYPEEEIFGILPMIVGSLYVTALSIIFWGKHWDFLCGISLTILSAET
nr:hypothetical protein [Helicobacter sp. MIT 99-5507]